MVWSSYLRAILVGHDDRGGLRVAYHVKVRHDVPLIVPDEARAGAERRLEDVEAEGIHLAMVVMVAVVAAMMVVVVAAAVVVIVVIVVTVAIVVVVAAAAASRSKLPRPPCRRRC